MKAIRVVSKATLSLLLGISAFAHAQERTREPEQVNQGLQHVQQRRNNNRRGRHTEGRRIEQAAWRQHRAQSWLSEHRTWQQRGGYEGYSIPANHFRDYFGPRHKFQIYGLPYMVVNGYPRFQYRSYWFSPVDPWPESWSSNWYDIDTVYIDYVNNGYYLYNRRYPKAAIAVNVSL